MKKILDREQLNTKYVEFPVLECFEKQTKEKLYLLYDGDGIII